MKPGFSDRDRCDRRLAFVDRECTCGVWVFIVWEHNA